MPYRPFARSSSELLRSNRKPNFTRCTADGESQDSSSLASIRLLLLDRGSELLPPSDRSATLMLPSESIDDTETRPRGSVQYAADRSWSVAA